MGQAGFEHARKTRPMRQGESERGSPSPSNAVLAQYRALQQLSRHRLCCPGQRRIRSPNSGLASGLALSQFDAAARRNPDDGQCRHHESQDVTRATACRHDTLLARNDAAPRAGPAGGRNRGSRNFRLSRAHCRKGVRADQAWCSDLRFYEPQANSNGRTSGKQQGKTRDRSGRAPHDQWGLRSKCCAVVMAREPVTGVRAGHSEAWRT